MRIHELSRDECLEVLARASIARLACARDGQPYVVPVSIVFDRDCLYSFSTSGQKIAWMRENPRVCVEVDEVEDPRRWVTVLAFGTFEELTLRPEHRDARETASRLFRERPGWWEPAIAQLPSGQRFSPVIYRIAITRVSGRRTASATHGPNGPPPSSGSR
jgi:nitroimidazol reductase NimA-like FMN-containing flavoprotein (pyridoxamine 5'-phosphate oxidase superfamily)